jgi:outer membrane protein TolC
MPPFRGLAAQPLAVLAAALLSGSGCSLVRPPSVAPPRELAQEVARTPPATHASAARAEPAPPLPVAPRSLSDLVDLALSRDPATRAAWFDARAAAAQASSRRGLYLPSVDVNGALVRQETAAGPSRPSTVQTTLGPSASLTWILLDLGGRGALVDEADRLFVAARLAEHQAVADLVLRVQQTYFQYLAARALVEAEGAALKQAETSLAAAEGRRQAGVATIAEVLQARTALSQVQLALQQVEGQSLALRGALATLAGLPPTAALEDVGALPAEVDVAAAQPAVDELLAAAEARNPELGRARALADAAEARARAASRVWFPVLAAQASAGRTWWLDPSGMSPSTAWSAGLVLRIPTFQGLSPAFDALALRATAEAARARAEAAGQGVALSVWTSFQGVRTSARRVDTSRDLLASAQASAEVATGRYKEGVGSILDLLTAQAALESARAEHVRSRADFLLSIAQLARTTGQLDLPPPGAAASKPEGTANP